MKPVAYPLYDVNDPRITPAVRKALDRIMPAAKAVLDACETQEQRAYYAKWMLDELHRIGESA